ncbi:DUF6053 domain-containing protein [Lysobacter enzymogenes]|uniref:DUF6053 domain-containing protein n=1 Tax=Lysobacter enzymogenes TaxID=69 RepID=UPI003D18991A
MTRAKSVGPEGPPTPAHAAQARTKGKGRATAALRSQRTSRLRPRTRAGTTP